MRFTITRLGGAGRSVDRIVAAIVGYLRPRTDATPEPAADRPGGGVDGPTRYYTDGGEEPGRWRGRGAEAAALVGEVDMSDFGQVLAGRDPRTGGRLVTARGSAGRRSTLGVGQPTRVGPEVVALYDVPDVAAALGLPARQVEDMLRAGEIVTVARLFGLPVPPQPPGSYLAPIVDIGGGRWVTELELSRCRSALEIGPASAEIEASGRPGDVIGMAEAARLTGLTQRYLRRLAQRHEASTTTRAGGTRRSNRAALPAQRGTGGRWLVRRQDLADFVRARRPPAVRVGFDLTLTTEKSLGVLALLSPASTRQRVLEAIEAGNDWGVDWLEANAAAVRVGDQVIPVDGWTVASFRHLTSRRLDPFPHHHNIVANTAIGPEGRGRALDARPLYAHAKAASALATAEMRHRLTEALSVRWRPGRSGTWEVAGIPDDVLHEFSQRRNEIEEALREIEEAIGHGTSLEDVDRAALLTRPDKRHVAVADLVTEWWERARRLGFGPDVLEACTGLGPVLSEPDTETVHAALAARGGVCANVSIFNRGDPLMTLVNLPFPAGGEQMQPLVVPAQWLEEIADGFLASDHVELLEPATANRPALYTTSEALAVQDRIVGRFRSGLDTQAAIVTRPAVDASLAWHPQLSAQQRALVRAFCTSGHRVQCAIGHPGSGKTTAMAAAARAWETAGWRVLGAAVKGEAARTLGVAAGIPSETLAWYLAHPDPQAAPLDARTVLIVDEASTISDRDLDHLGWLADQTGATLRLIGDPAQHGAVEAGGMFRVLCEQHPDHTPVLTGTHRLQHPDDRAAADHLRAGDVSAALDALDRAGHLHIVEDELHAYADVLTRWWTAHLLGHHHPMVNRLNSVRRSLNRLAHALRQAHGEIGTDEISATGDRRYAVGDRVIARRPDRDLHPTGQPAAYVRNGAIGTVTAIHRGGRRADDVLVVRFEHLGDIALPRSFFDVPPPEAGDPPGGGRDVGLDHAYALTSYAVTGATHAVSTSRIDEDATRAETYVDITRGQHANHLYLTRRADPLDGEQLPRIPPEPLDEDIADQLTRSQGERTAWEIRQAQLDRTTPTPGPLGR